MAIRVLKNITPFQYIKLYRHDIITVFSWQKLTEKERTEFLALNFDSPEVDGDVERLHENARESLWNATTHKMHPSPEKYKRSIDRKLRGTFEEALDKAVNR
jgi:hypothetical protein